MIAPRSSRIASVRKEHLERLGNPAAEEREDAEREGNVGGGRNCPAPQRDGIPAIQKPVDHGGCRHAPDRGQGGERELGPIRELAFHHLALDLQADEKEEHGHQPVVDPQDERLAEHERPDADLDRRAEKGLIQALCPGVGQDERDRRRDHQQDAARGFEAQEFTDCAGDALTGAGNIAYGHGPAILAADGLWRNIVLARPCPPSRSGRVLSQPCG